jgi:hypothetical protein
MFQVADWLVEHDVAGVGSSGSKISIETVLRTDCHSVGREPVLGSVEMDMQGTSAFGRRLDGQAAACTETARSTS